MNAHSFKFKLIAFKPFAFAFKYANSLIISALETETHLSILIIGYIAKKQCQEKLKLK